MAGKPKPLPPLEPTPMPKRTLHPALKQRAQQVKAAHAHLAKTVPGFTQLHPHDRVRQTQQHVKRAKGGGY